MLELNERAEEIVRKLDAALDEGIDAETLRKSDEFSELLKLWMTGEIAFSLDGENLFDRLLVRILFVDPSSDDLLSEEEFAERYKRGELII